MIYERLRRDDVARMLIANGGCADPPRFDLDRTIGAAVRATPYTPYMLNKYLEIVDRFGWALDGVSRYAICSNAVFLSLSLSN